MAYSLEEMEEYLRKMYERAGEDLMYKAGQYMLDFKRLEEQHKKDVENGKWTQEQFDTWRKNKLLYGMHWTRMIQTVQRDMAKVNQTALDYINGKIPQIFAQTYNEVAEKVPKSPVSGYSFELVNADTVKNLIHEEGIILPPKKNLDKQKDKLWNAKQVNAQLLQGILQGESIKKIAARMQNVANADLVGATRTARTMCTAAENSGRQSAYNRAAEDGIKFTKTWIAALQGNTRDTHIYLNQQTQPHDKPFESSSGAVLMFPGDWHAPPAEVYNCRCTMITNFKGFDKVKLKEAVKRQEAVEEQVAKEQSVENLQYVSDINDIRDTFNQTTDAEERDKLLQEAGAVMYERVRSLQEEIQARHKRFADERLTASRAHNEVNEQLKPFYNEERAILRKLMWYPEEEEKKQLEEALRKLQEKYDLLISEKERLEKALREAMNKEREDAQKGRKELYEFTRSMLAEIRPCGTDKQSDYVIPVKGKKNAKQCTEIIRDNLQYYPTAWIEASINNGKDPFTCKEIKRGHFSKYENQICLSGNDELELNRTAAHEMGHAFEAYVENILNADRYFYERRTQGEKSVWIGYPYPKDEVGKRDNFLDVYMGKDYDGRSFELVSMGFDSYIYAPDEIMADKDYAQHIMGILALC